MIVGLVLVGLQTQVGVCQPILDDFFGGEKGAERIDKSTIPTYVWI
jgi:hypothetical protein